MVEEAVEAIGLGVKIGGGGWCVRVGRWSGGWVGWVGGAVMEEAVVAVEVVVMVVVVVAAVAKLPRSPALCVGHGLHVAAARRACVVPLVTAREKLGSVLAHKACPPPFWGRPLSHAGMLDPSTRPKALLKPFGNPLDTL